MSKSEKKPDNREVRYFSARVEIREGGDDNKQPLIEGYAAVYEQESENLGGFVEVIEPGFFDGVLGGDTRSLWNHNSDLVLGRTRSGTLSIESDGVGLKTTTTPPDNSWGRDAVVSMRRGDVDQMSFAFAVREGGDRWAQREDGVMVRRLLRGGCEELFDVSPVTYPAYPQTSVSVRTKLASFVQGAEGGNQHSSNNGDGSQGRLALMRWELDLNERED